MNNLGALLVNDLGLLDEAESLLKQALKWRRVVLGPRHQETLTSVLNVAELLSDQGKLDEASALFEEELEVYPNPLSIIISKRLYAYPITPLIEIQRDNPILFLSKATTQTRVTMTLTRHAARFSEKIIRARWPRSTISQTFGRSRAGPMRRQP